MRLLVCGDRDWTDREAIRRELVVLPLDTVVIHGAARGADQIANDAALVLGLRVVAFPADWKRYGRAAGVIRNQQMLDEGEPDRVYAFHDHINESRGTLDMVTRARRAGIPTTVLFSHAK